jgi:hypothetical protein
MLDCIKDKTGFRNSWLNMLKAISLPYFNTLDPYVTGADDAMYQKRIWALASAVFKHLFHGAKTFFYLENVNGRKQKITYPMSLDIMGKIIFVYVSFQKFHHVLFITVFHIGIMEVHKNRHDGEIKYFGILCSEDQRNNRFVAKMDTQKRRRCTVPGAKKPSPKKLKSVNGKQNREALRTDDDDEEEEQLQEEEEEVETEVDEVEVAANSGDRDSLEKRATSATADIVQVNLHAWRGFQNKIIADNLANGFVYSQMPPPQKRSTVSMKSPRSAESRQLYLEEVAAADARRLEAINERVRLCTLEREQEEREARKRVLEEEFVPAHEKDARAEEAQLADLLARLQQSKSSYSPASSFSSPASSSSGSSSSSSSSSSSTPIQPRILPAYAYQGLFKYLC